ncbi:MFS transporter [Nocardia sp. NPDC101769]|uniref:MFS transporter n=1 Tax=Nocardia sp. NPDC101769 TaxID=3364333 RepID=UPI003818612E
MLDNPAATMQYPVTKRAFGLAILVLSGLQLMVVLDGTVMILALPRLQEQLGLSSAGSAWTVTAYGLPFAGLMLLGGRLGDSFGRKRMLILGVALFTLASALCGTAQNEAWLIAARALQGTGAAIAAPTAFALVASTYAPGPARNQAVAIFGSMVGVGSVGGLVIGGALTQVDWRWIFWINVPIGILIVWGAIYQLRDTARHRMSMDVRGAILGTLACVSIVFGATEGPEMGWGSPVILGAVIGGLILLVVFVFAERDVANPLLPWSLFKSRDRVITFGAIFLTSGVLGATTFFVAQFLQNVLRYNPLHAGLASIPFTLGAGVGTAVASKACMYVRARWLLLAAAVVLAGALYFGSTLDSSADYFPTLLVMMSVVGFCVGTAIVILPLCVLVGVDMAHIGPLSAVGQMFMNMGTPFAVGVLSPVALSRTLSLDKGATGKVSEMSQHQIDALGSGYTLVLLVCAIGTAVMGLLALTLRYTPTQLAQAQHTQDEAQKS